MATANITIHNQDFIIDTMDWYHSDDAETVSDLIACQMDAWSAEKAARVHSLMVQAQEGTIDADHGELEEVQRMCAECASIVLDTYKSYPSSGHNHDIAAVSE